MFMEATAYRCLRSSDSYQGKSLFTQREPITLRTCHSEGLERNYKVARQVKREQERRLSHEREPQQCVIPKHGAPRQLSIHRPACREEGAEEEKLEKQNKTSPEDQLVQVSVTSDEKQILQTMTVLILRPSADDVNQWAQSLDKLLGHKYGKAAFCIFLKSEFCEENIEFWTACEDFRTLTSHRELVSKANSIYEEFIKCEAPKEINLDFHTKNAIVQSLGEPTTTSFVAAQRKVYSLMENNSYPRFIHSDLYKELCEAAGREGKHIKS
ncbi:hypothetical protein INR49_018460 [Caranx melampygus]|nr:hypothetical protein INR49_018460 [Caranx melampygus]